MKKLLILSAVVVTAILSGCSSDKNKSEPIAAPANFMKSTVNGVDVNYDFMTANKQSYTSNGIQYTDLIINASKSDDPSKSITFKSAYLQPGSQSVFYFELNNNQLEYDTNNLDSFITLTESTANRVRGTFAGTLSNFDNTNSAVVTNGSFDIRF